MPDAVPPAPADHEPLRRFWRGARGFWRSRDGAVAWGLIGLLVICVVLQVSVQYRLNLWNRDFFNALEFRDGHEIWRQTYLLMAFAVPSIGLAVFAVWCRMTFQRQWRAWLTSTLIDAWLGDERYRRLDLWNGEHQNAEYRIAEDARLATDAPIDLLAGLLGSLLSATTFVVVLWHVGGALSVELSGLIFSIPGYLVVAAIVYAALTTGTNAATVIVSQPNHGILVNTGAITLTGSATQTGFFRWVLTWIPLDDGATVVAV